MVAPLFAVLSCVVGILAAIIYTVSAIKAIRDRRELKRRIEARRSGIELEEDKKKRRPPARNIIVIHDGKREERLRRGEMKPHKNVVFTKENVPQTATHSFYGSCVDLRYTGSRNASPVDAAKNISNNAIWLSSGPALPTTPGNTTETTGQTITSPGIMTRQTVVAPGTRTVMTGRAVASPGTTTELTGQAVTSPGTTTELTTTELTTPELPGKAVTVDLTYPSSDGSLGLHGGSASSSADKLPVCVMEAVSDTGSTVPISHHKSNSSKTGNSAISTPAPPSPDVQC